MSPSQWCSSDTWPTGVTKGNLTGLAGTGTGTKFNSIFTAKPLAVDNSLYVVLRQYASIPTLTTIAAGIAALWLNAKAGQTGGVISTDRVVALWTNIATNNGYLAPGTTVPWTLAATQTWLAYTWGEIPV
jgi:hypothetical protein